MHFVYMDISEFHLFNTSVRGFGGFEIFEFRPVRKLGKSTTQASAAQALHIRYTGSADPHRRRNPGAQALKFGASFGLFSSVSPRSSYCTGAKLNRKPVIYCTGAKLNRKRCCLIS